MVSKGNDPVVWSLSVLDALDSSNVALQWQHNHLLFINNS